MTNSTVPMQMGLAEFITKLLEEVSEGIISAQIDQERRIIEISELVTLPEDKFSERMVSDEMIEAELSILFPTNIANTPHRIYSGASYRSEGPSIRESPELSSILGVKLMRNDLTHRRGAITFKDSAVKKVKQEVRSRIAGKMQGALQEIYKLGIPRIVIDSGRINSKATFDVVRIRDIKKSDKSISLVAQLKPLADFRGPSKSRIPSDTRIIIRQADERAPQLVKLHQDIFGEVEITYKMIS